MLSIVEKGGQCLMAKIDRLGKKYCLSEFQFGGYQSERNDALPLLYFMGRGDKNVKSVSTNFPF